MRVHHAKLAMGGVLFILALGIVGGLAVLQFLSTPDAGAGSVHVVVDHEGDVMYNGTVGLGNATALAALYSASRDAGFEVEARHYPGQGTYVVAIGSYRETGNEGWLYCVGVDPCTHPKIAADRYALKDGDRVTWHWGTADDGLT